MDETYGTADSFIPFPVVAAVAGGVAAAIALAALIPALRISFKPTNILLHSAPAGRPRGLAPRLSRVVYALPVARSVAFGLAAPLRRPGRSAALATTIVTGTACLTLSVGLAVSLGGIQHSRNPLTGADVQVGPRLGDLIGPGSAGTPPPRPVLADAAAVRGAISDTAGAGKVFGVTEIPADVAGLVGGTDIVGISGDISFTHHQMVAGHWLTGAGGEAVAPTRALTALGKSVGDHLTITLSGHASTVTIVGEVFDLSHDGMSVYVDGSALRTLGSTATVDRYFVQLAPGTDSARYPGSLSKDIAAFGAQAARADDGTSSVIDIMNAIAALLAAILLAVTAIGILGAAMLQVRDRVRDLGIFAAIGMAPLHAGVMTLTSVGAVGIVAGAIGVPIGIALHHSVVPAMGATAGARLAPHLIDVYSAPLVVALVLAGAVLALAGAAGPALWASRVRPATALRTE